ncbi:hypothetical protein Tco_0382102 [Tanacetum coccineum]
MTQTWDEGPNAAVAFMANLSSTIEDAQDTRRSKLDLENKVRQEQALVIQRNKRNAELVQENDLLKSTLSGKEKSIAFLQSEKETVLSEEIGYLADVRFYGKRAHLFCIDADYPFAYPITPVPMKANTHSRTAYTEKLVPSLLKITKLKAKCNGTHVVDFNSETPKCLSRNVQLRTTAFFLRSNPRKMEPIKRVWKQISKPVANSKPQWKPTGRHFSLFEKHPLTRIMESTDQPIELPPSATSSPKRTMVSRFTDHKLSDRQAGSIDCSYRYGFWMLETNARYWVGDFRARLIKLCRKFIESIMLKESSTPDSQVGQFCDGEPLRVILLIDSVPPRYRGRPIMKTAEREKKPNLQYFRVFDISAILQLTTMTLVTQAKRRYRLMSCSNQFWPRTSTNDFCGPKTVQNSNYCITVRTQSFLTWMFVLIPPVRFVTRLMFCCPGPEMANGSLPQQLSQKALYARLYSLLLIKLPLLDTSDSDVET